jgi:hypothetical protein
MSDELQLVALTGSTLIADTNYYTVSNDKLKLVGHWATFSLACKGNDSKNSFVRGDHCRGGSGRSF